MSRFVCSCFALLFAAGVFVFGPFKIQAQVPEKKPEDKQPSLVELAKLYQELDLPLPPKEARFARVYWGEGGSKGREKKKILYNLAFCVKGSPPNQPHRIWISFYFTQKIPQLGYDVGFKVDEVFENPPKPETIQPFLDLDSLSGPKFELGETSYPKTDWETNRRELIFAIQCHLLKHNEIARFYFRRYLNGTKLTQEDLKETLVIAAWNYRVLELADPVRDRRATAAILRRILKDFDFMSDVERINRWNRHDEFLDLLDLSLQPSKAKPGSVEAIIDSLVDGFTKNHYFWSQDEDFRDFWIRDRQIEERKKAYAEKRSDMEIRLSKLGFEAVPALIDHLDDKRLTRCPWTPDLLTYAGPTFDHHNFETIDYIARQILEQYFEVKIVDNEGKLLRDDTGKEITFKEAYSKKWQQVKIKNDLEYLTQSIENNTCETNFTRFIMDRFPEKIIPFYKKILEKTCKNQSIGRFVYHIVDSNLPKKEKIDLLMLGARHKHAPFQIDSLEGLLELDQSVFTQCCLESSSGLSKEIHPIENRFIPQLEIPKLALCSGDAKVQAAVLEFVKNLPLPAKMKFLNVFINGSYRPSMIHALVFLKHFLDDKEKYQTNKDDDKIYEHGIWRFTAIEVRNFAAYKILEIMDIDLSLNDKTTEEEWEKVRAFAKDEVERRMELEKVK